MNTIPFWLLSSFAFVGVFFVIWFILKFIEEDTTEDLKQSGHNYKK